MNSCRSQPCQNGGQCHNQGTSYYCQCAPGYRGNRCENGECYFLVLIDTLQLNHRWLKRGKQAFYNKLLHLWLSEIKSNPLTWFLITNSSLRLERIHTISKMLNLHCIYLFSATQPKTHKFIVAALLLQACCLFLLPGRYQANARIRTYRLLWVDALLLAVSRLNKLDLLFIHKLDQVCNHQVASQTWRNLIKPTD